MDHATSRRYGQNPGDGEAQKGVPANFLRRWQAGTQGVHCPNPNCQRKTERRRTMGLKWVHEVVSSAFDFTNFRRTDGKPFSTHILAVRPTVSNSFLESLTSETRASVFCFVSLTIFIAANLTEYSYLVNTFSDLLFAQFPLVVAGCKQYA